MTSPHARLDAAGEKTTEQNDCDSVYFTDSAFFARGVYVSAPVKEPEPCLIPPRASRRSSSSHAVETGNRLQRVDWSRMREKAFGRPAVEEHAAPQIVANEQNVRVQKLLILLVSHRGGLGCLCVWVVDMCVISDESFAVWQLRLRKTRQAHPITSRVPLIPPPVCSAN